MGEYRVLERMAWVVAGIFLVAFTASLIHLGVTKNEALFKINSALIYPALVCLILFICLVLNLITDIRKGRGQERAPVTKLVKDEYTMVTVIFLCLVVYVLLLKYVYLPFSIFVPTTIIYSTLVSVAINDSDESILGKSAKALGVSAGFVITIYYSFSRIFGVILP